MFVLSANNLHRDSKRPCFLCGYLAATRSSEARYSGPATTNTWKPMVKSYARENVQIRKAFTRYICAVVNQVHCGIAKFLPQNASVIRETFYPRKFQRKYCARASLVTICAIFCLLVQYICNNGGIRVRVTIGFTLCI